MVHNLVHNLCESLVENIGGVSGATPHKVVVATPVIALTGNSVTITCDTTGVTIYYTLDGNTPTTSSTQYSSAFTLDSSCTIKAIAIKGGKSSGIAEEEYVKPITYLTEWKMLGNSEVHTDEYLTQWKVEGNSVVDNNAILSCGDLGQDNKYHVKISDGVDVYDITLNEPLRKVNDVADKIEFVNGVATLTRKIASAKWNDLTVTYQSEREYKRFLTSSITSLINKPTDFFERVLICLSSDFIQNNAPLQSSVETNPTDLCMAVYSDGFIYVRDTSTTSAEDFYEKYGTHEFLYRLATPTTETIQVSPFPISPTDTYTSANDTPYSAFEYKKNVEIWSCGEYNAVDGKYHILVQPQGGSIADIALDEPLRKVNDVADSIELVNGVVTLTRAYKKIDWDTVEIIKNTTNNYFSVNRLALKYGTMNVLSNLYPVYSRTTPVADFGDLGIGSGGAESSPILRVVNTSMNDLTATEFAAANAAAGIEIIYELATPTTETIQVPQIEEADSYTCVISQGGKAVSWSGFETN